jgi:outer membrane protein assembly factor BamE (lipoprotein component of BamABCDE complex)
MAPKPVIALAAAVMLGAGLSACAPTVSYNGFQAREERPQDVKPGVDTKSTVLSRLGSPSMVSTFEPNIWFYISQVTSKVAYKEPSLKSRNITAITFAADEKVQAVNNYDINNSYKIAYAKEETPTRGRQITVLEQLLGNVGRGGMLPQQDDIPGQRPTN